MSEGERQLRNYRLSLNMQVQVVKHLLEGKGKSDEKYNPKLSGELIIE